MNGVADNAVGAILEIPQGALDKIDKAEQAIKQLGETSERVAKEVSNHWGTIAPDGLQRFIDKIAQAKEAMGGLSGGKIDLSVNTQPLENQLNNASNAAKKTASDVSESVQTLAMQNLDFTNIQRLGESIMALDGTYKQVEATIKSLERGREAMATESTEAQATSNMIQLLKEYIELKKKSEEQQKTKTTVFDQNILNEQKTLLQQILQYQKDINAETQRQERVSALGKTIPQEDIDKLRNYKTELDRLTEAYGNLRSKIDEMSAAGQKRFNEAEVKADLALARERTDAQDKLNQALQMTSKYTSETKLKSAGISSREEGIYMNELVAVYRQMIELIKKRGEVEAQVASQGYAQTTAQTNLLQTIQTEYDRLNASLANVTGKYTEIDRAVKSTFENTKTMQEAENAAKLADAYQKAAEAVEKRRKAEAKTEQTDLSKDKAEYKQILTLIERMQKAWRTMQEALANTNMPSNLAQQLQMQVKSAEAAMDTLYARKAEIEARRGAELTQIQNQHEAQRGAASVAEFEKAEKEKTRIAKQEATDRYNEEMRQARLQNQALTAQGKQQRMTINDAREQRAIELEKQRQQEVARLRQEIDRLDKTDVNYQKNLDRLNQRINELLGTTQRRVSYTREEAMAMAKSATTLREYENAYKALKDAMATTDPKSDKWKEMNSQLQKTKQSIDEIKKKMGEFQSQSQKTSNIMGQLQGRIAAAFSVGAIGGFLKKVTEVRAQFELQRVALGAIIQDRDEANKIFTQVQNMALESPFSIMQLERATKQIAAFGFEAKKLVPTMKMFADISAGLGVEIDRLVLVMGHLKARNFLEGTMVRQFTNMGFNVLGELSKYYSELENKMVSVGEVQDRVKKKMVSFADVEEVLKRVTSAGGMFYDMQKKQSDSIWGQMQRIKDAYDLMLNEIGQGNEGSIKGVLTLVRTLISSWRTLSVVIKSVGAAIAMYFAVSRWGAITTAMRGVVQAFKNMKIAIMEVNAAQQTLNATQKANAWGLIISLIVAAAVAVWELVTAQSKLNEAMDRVRSEGIGNMYELIANYQKLADTVKDTNKPYEEQKKALDEIKRVYAEILPDEMLEIKNIKAMSNGYEEATAAIKAYSAEKIKANLKSEIENIVGKDISTQETDISDWITFNFTPDKMPKNTFRAYIKTILTEVSEEVKNGSIPVEKALDEFKKRTTTRLRNIVSEDWLERFNKISKGTNLMLLKNIREWESNLQKYQDEMSGVSIGLEEEESKELEIVKKQYQDLTDAVDKYKKAIEALRLAKEEGQVKGDVTQGADGKFTAENDGQMGAKALENLNKAQQDLEAQTKKWGVTWKTTVEEVNAAIESQTGQMNYFEQTNTNVFTRVLSGLDKWQARFRNDDSVRAWIEKTLKEADKLDLSDVQNKILDVAVSVVSANGMQVGSLDKLRLASLNSFGDAAKAAQSVYNQLAQNEIAIQTQIKTLMHYGRTAAQAKMLAEAEYGAGMTLEEIKEMMKLYKELIPAFGGTFKDPNKSKSKKSSDAELKRWQDLKKAIEDVSTAYDKYRKSFTVEESNKRIEELFGPVFKELNTDIKQFYKDGKYDAESMIKALEVLKGMTNATTKEREKFRSEIERKIGTTQVEIEVKMKEDAEKKLKADLDEMFASYELSKELKKLGLSVDLVFMLGGEPLDLNDLRAKLKKGFEEAGGESAPENIVKEYKDRLKKIEELELKERKERVKEYHKYFVKTVGERAQIELEYLKKMDDVRKMYEFTDAQRQDALRQLTEEKNKKLAEQVWKDFKDGSVYQMMFQDLDAMSEKTLVTMRTELERIRDSFKGISPQQLKEINKAIQDIDNQIAARNPFKTLGNSFKDLIKFSKERKRLEKDYQDAIKRSGELTDEIFQKETQLAQLRDKSALYKADQVQSQIDNLKKQIAELEKDELTAEEQAKIDALNEQIKLLEEKKKKLQEIAALNMSDENAMYAEIQRLESEVAKLNEELGKTKEKGSQAGKSLSSGSAKAAAIRQAFNQIKQYAEETVSHLDGIIKGLDRMGVLTDAAKDNWESFKDGFESVNDIAEGGIKVWTGFLSGNYADMVNGTLQGIKGTINLIASIFEVGDKKKERQIKSLKDSVESLDKAYQKLEKSIESAYTFSQYNAEFDKAEQNLDEQKKAYQEIIALEEAKKKSDKEKVKEYTEKLDEIAEKEEELRKQRIEDMGSTTDYLNEAQSFVDAWLDAYKETGDGIDALGDKWEEFIENLFVKQGAAQIVSARLKPIIEKINTAIEERKTDFDLSDAVNEARAEWEKISKDIPPLLEQLFGSYGLTGGKGELILSDLQKGIQNITEPQAAAIEAYLNSMRFAVFTHTEQLERLIATVQAQYGSGAENPVVTELKGIRSVLDSINSKFDSVIGKNGFQNGIRIAT